MWWVCTTVIIGLPKPFLGLPVLPLQCYNCQRMGHTATSCKAKIRCLLCGVMGRMKSSLPRK